MYKDLVTQKAYDQLLQKLCFLQLNFMVSFIVIAKYNKHSCIHNWANKKQFVLFTPGTTTQQ